MNDMNQGVTFNLGGQGPLPSGEFSIPWSDLRPRNDTENWRYNRRAEVGQFAVPVMVALLHGGDAVRVGEDWQGEGHDAEQETRDALIVARAVRIATMLQDAIDKARPR